MTSVASSNTRVLSIDVGYRNLAYCILEIDQQQREKFIKVIEWDNVDLYLLNSNSTELNMLSYSLIGNITSLSKNELVSICSQESIDPKIENKKETTRTKTKTKTKKTKQTEENKEEEEETQKQMNNLSQPISYIPIEKLQKQVLADALQVKIKMVKERHYRCACLTNDEKNDKFYALRVNICLSKLRTFFDSKIDMLHTIDYVVIENQPKKKNAFLGTLQAMLHSFFYFRIMDNSYHSLFNSIQTKEKQKKSKKKIPNTITTHTTNQIFRVQLIHAKHKTNLLLDNQLNAEELSESKKALLNYNTKNKKQKKDAEYKCRKDTGKVHCKKIINKFCQNNSEWKNLLKENASKADDLSDCFLQGLHFFKIIDILPELHF